MKSSEMKRDYEAVIGLEIHAELATKSKMFCTCPVVDTTLDEPNIAVCPVCAGMPGVLPVVNQRAVELGLKVALALQCEIPPSSIFARKNYFYPDLPKGYQISQYERPLAIHGILKMITSQGDQVVRIRRVHLEEDTGKLTHLTKDGQSYSLIDLNRAGIPLLEIVSEPELHSAEDVRVYASTLRNLLRYLEVNSGDMQKGVLRIEPNVSVRLAGSQELGTRTEIKNLNSFRALERSIDFEIKRQVELLAQGKPVIQETLGWDDIQSITFPQRSKEEAHDYRYFPEPDLPPLVVKNEWVAKIRSSLPELPVERLQRFTQQYKLSLYDAEVLTAEQEVADYFEEVLRLMPDLTAKNVANWIYGELFGLIRAAGVDFSAKQITPFALGQLLLLVKQDEINQGTAKSVLAEMFQTSKSAEEIINGHGLRQISDRGLVADLVTRVLKQYPEKVQAYKKGKRSLERWLFGQIMQLAEGRANPKVLEQELRHQLENHNEKA